MNPPVDEPALPDITVGIPEDTLVPSTVPVIPDVPEGTLPTPVVELIGGATDPLTPRPGQSNTYMCKYSKFGIYGYSWRGAPGASSRGTGSTIFGGQDLNHLTAFGGSKAARYHAWVGVGVAVNHAVTAVRMGGTWQYRGTVETDPGYSVVTGPGGAELDIDFTSKVVQKQTGQDDQYSVHGLSSKSFDYATRNDRIQESGSASHSIGLSRGNKSIYFVLDLLADLSVFSPAGDSARSRFEFGPAHDNYIRMGLEQVWVFTLKPGYGLASCG